MRQLLTVDQACQKLLAVFSPLEQTTIALNEAGGRILALDVASEIDLPLFSNSSMDGFAVRAADVAKAISEDPVELEVVADVPAGRVSPVGIESGQAVRIMTGAPMPPGADAIVPIEDTDQYSQGKPIDNTLPKRINVNRAVNSGDYVRPQGQDVRSGETVLYRGVQLRPQDLGLLAMLGISQVPVFNKPKIALLSTGDELIPVEQPLSPGKIHDSNAYTLSAQIQRDGAECINLGIVPDRQAAVEEALEQAHSSRVDLILSSAGVSVGAFDFVRTVVEINGAIEFWRVNMRPGKPLTFGNYKAVPFIGLPGNPVSAFVGYEVFVLPAIRKLSGVKDLARTRFRVRLEDPIESDGRESYLRAIVSNADGDLRGRLTGHQGSGNLLSLVQANALLIIPSGVKSLPANAEVDAWLLDGDPEVTLNG